MNTNKPQTGATSPQQGSQICNNTQTQGETDFVNYSAASAQGGFCFQQMSTTNTLTNLATMYRNGAACNFNLPNPSSQFQIGGVNILDGIAAAAPINSPNFTGTPTAPNPVTGNSSTQIATTKFVEDAIIASGVFSPDVSYTWGSSYQRLGNDQVLCVGSSTMNTTKPQTGATAAQQGSQICNNTQTLGETDFVNYSAAGAGGFCFQQMSSTNALATLGTLYRSGAASILNLPNASSQFQINGVSVARQLTSTLVNTRVPSTISYTAFGQTATYTSNIVSAIYISTNTINGVNSVNVGWQTGNVTPIAAPLEISSTVFTGSTFTTIVPIAQLNGPVPSNYQSIAFTINMYLGTSGSIGNQLLGYGGVTRDTNNNYWVVFASYANINTTTAICFSPFTFSYQ
jgi:hypothetical protein